MNEARGLAIHWFRRDLRLRDNTALSQASRDFDGVLPVFVFDPHLLEADDIGGPRVAFLLEALRGLARSLADRGVPLVFRTGSPREVLPALAREAGAVAVVANRDYSPYGRRRDAEVEEALRGDGVAWRDHGDLVLVEPWECLKDDGTPYTVFTPYARRWRGIAKCVPERIPRLDVPHLPSSRSMSVGSLPTLSELGFRLDADVDVGTRDEAATHRRLQRFISKRIERYRSDRDIPAIDGTSGLSADLKFGTVSPRQVYAKAASFVGEDLIDLDPANPRKPLRAAERERLLQAGTFVNELCWRDFYQSVLYHFPHVLGGSFRSQYARLQWPERRPEIIAAWVEGRTGFPIVDAGMRQLARTGWMHNRLRMLTASFLTKILLVDWRVGERVFMQRLVDGDPAANNGGWQWCASTGTDASPYFRIFNPLLQSKKFDPDGVYIRRWVPELADVAAPLIHEPARDEATLERTGYPRPCVDYATRRAEALELLGQRGRSPKPASGARTAH